MQCISQFSQFCWSSKFVTSASLLNYMRLYLINLVSGPSPSHAPFPFSCLPFLQWPQTITRRACKLLCEKTITKRAECVWTRLSHCLNNIELVVVYTKALLIIIFVHFARKQKAKAQCWGRWIGKKGKLQRRLRESWRRLEVDHLVSKETLVNANFEIKLHSEFNYFLNEIDGHLENHTYHTKAKWYKQQNKSQICQFSIFAFY